MRKNVDNNDRAGWGEAALETFSRLTGIDRLSNDEDAQDCIADLICDLGHYASTRGFDLCELAERGIGMWSAERREAEPYRNDEVAIVVTHYTRR